MNRREVWITGCGAVTAAGIGTPALEAALYADRLLVAPEGKGTLPIGRAPDLPASRQVRRLDRSARLFLAAATEAWEGAGLPPSAPDPCRCAVIEGSSLGPMSELIEEAERAGARNGAALEGPARRGRPFDLVRFMTGAGGAFFAQTRGVAGPVMHVSCGSVSSASAIGEAASWVASGRADLVVAGGAESPLHPDVLELFRAAGILAYRDGEPAACLPFDERRCGTWIGEGAGVVVLESAERAMARGQTPHAVLSGYGMACEPHSMTAPDPAGSGLVAAVREALGYWFSDGSRLPDGARLRASAAIEIGWIKAHATGTQQGDAAESRGLAAALGPMFGDLPISGLKPLLGHCLGASGAVEAVAAVLALRRGLIPATLGTRNIDADLPPCRVATRSIPLEAPGALLLSESFGGRAAALVLRAA